MKKAKKIQYGIEIVKPWSKAMYDHNDQVAEAVKVKVHEMWTRACSTESEEFASDMDPKTPKPLQMNYLFLSLIHTRAVGTVRLLEKSQLRSRAFARVVLDHSSLVAWLWKRLVVFQNRNERAFQSVCQRPIADLGGQIVSNKCLSLSRID